MTSNPMVAAEHEDRDQLLAQLLEKLLDNYRSGQSIDFAIVAKDHPELAGELRSLWATAIVADDLGTLTLEISDLENPIAKEESESERDGTTNPDTMPRFMADYELLEEIGRGGMGVVYRARQMSLGRTVAIKMILRGEFASKVDLARFRGEAESAARLEHPNVVPVHEVGEWDGQPYFSMKLVNGTTLARRLETGPLPAREAASLLIPICQAIGEAHRRGILHRDLKPSNILIDADGRPHVSDFGLAKRVETGSQVTRSGLILGTPSYMAPEQAAGTRGEIGPASDIYALGAILYHMLTGRPPFQAATAVDTILMVLDQEPLPPRVLNRKADPDLEMIALKCLEKSQEFRYPSAIALAEDLEAYLANEPVRARDTNLWHWFERMFRDTHHAPLLESWGLLWMWHGIVVLILCLITNWLSYQGYESPGPYLALWTVGMGAWAALFWDLRRRGGPITFVERQIAHIWGASVLCSSLLFVVEMQLGLPVLTLSPVLALLSGAVFMMKAAILSGSFYIQALASFACALAMARFPAVGLTLFGLLCWANFFFPGLKYYRLRQRGTRNDFER
ncbi:MAG: serine/threonine-protein kinase [Planctomycetota bacterium]